MVTFLKYQWLNKATDYNHDDGLDRGLMVLASKTKTPALGLKGFGLKARIHILRVSGCSEPSVNYARGCW